MRQLAASSAAASASTRSHRTRRRAPGPPAPRVRTAPRTASACPPLGETPPRPTASAAAACTQISPALQRAAKLAARHHLLARIATFLEVHAADRLVVQHLRHEGFRRPAASAWPRRCSPAAQSHRRAQRVASRHRAARRRDPERARHVARGRIQRRRCSRRRPRAASRVPWPHRPRCRPRPSRPGRTRRTPRSRRSAAPWRAARTSTAASRWPPAGPGCRSAGCRRRAAARRSSPACGPWRCTAPPAGPRLSLAAGRGSPASAGRAGIWPPPRPWPGSRRAAAAGRRRRVETGAVPATSSGAAASVGKQEADSSLNYHGP